MLVRNHKVSYQWHNNRITNEHYVQSPPPQKKSLSVFLSSIYQPAVACRPKYNNDRDEIIHTARCVSTARSPVCAPMRQRAKNCYLDVNTSRREKWCLVCTQRFDFSSARTVAGCCETGQKGKRKHTHRQKKRKKRVGPVGTKRNNIVYTMVYLRSDLDGWCALTLNENIKKQTSLYYYYYINFYLFLHFSPSGAIFLNLALFLISLDPS